MAEITYPSAAKITALTLTPVNLNQSIHQLNTGGYEVINTGYGLWEGTVTWHSLKGDDAGQMEGMIAALNTAQHWIECPHHRPTLSKDITVVTAAAGAITVNSDAGLKVGMLFRAGNRTYMVTKVESALSAQIWPYKPLSIGDSLKKSTTIRIRSKQSSQLLQTPHWGGPWSIAWREAI